MNPPSYSRRAALVVFLCAAISFLLFSWTSAAPEMQANACFNAPATADPTPTVCVSNVTVLFNGTSAENQFYVSWRTPNPATGSVSVGETTFPDVRGASFKGVTHYIQINNLAAKTTYTFDIISAGNTYTNGGAHWSARLGPAIPATTPYFIFGRVKNPDETDADGALVYAQVRDGDDQGTNGRSGLLSAVIVLADGGDFFTINVVNARTPNNTQQYVFNPESDRVFVAAHGAQGSVSKVFKISELHPPKPPPSLILGDNGSGNVQTATPTLIPPTPTPTLSPTPTETETPPPTLTKTPAPPTETAEPLATDTPNVPPTFSSFPTLSPEQATRLAQEENATRIADAGQVGPDRTRVFGGVPVIQPPAPTNNNTWLFIGLALVLMVGAVLLGLAGIFIARR